MSSEESNRDGGSSGLPDVSEEEQRTEPYFLVNTYGALQAVDALPAEYIREVFDGTPAGQLHDLAEDIQNRLDDMAGAPDKYEGSIKDLAHKRSVVLQMADSREDVEVGNED